MLSKTRRVAVVGGHDLGCRCFQHLIDSGYEVVMALGRRDDHGDETLFPSLQKVALSSNTPFLRPAGLDDPHLLSMLKQAQPDVLFSLQNNHIFSKEWISYFSDRLGIVNVHLSPLPRYAGFWPELWAIWNGESEFGVSMHYVDESVDGGPLLSQYSVPIAPEETRRSLYQKCSDAAFAMFRDNLDRLLEGKVIGQPQDLSKRTYYKRELPNGGFIDFNWDGKTIERFIRALAFRPFTGAKVKVGQAVLTLLEEDLEFFKPVSINRLNYPR